MNYNTRQTINNKSIFSGSAVLCDIAVALLYRLVDNSVALTSADDRVLGNRLSDLLDARELSNELSESRKLHAVNEESNSGDVDVRQGQLQNATCKRRVSTLLYPPTQ